MQVGVQAFPVAPPGLPKVHTNWALTVLKDTVILFITAPLFCSPTFPSAQPHGGDPQAIIPTNAGAAPGGVPLSQRNPAQAGGAGEEPQSF